MILYSTDNLKTIYKSDLFIDKYKTYDNEYDLLKFLNSIDLNKDYYKLKLKSNYQTKASKSLKESLELLNKLTCNNYIEISKKILCNINNDILYLYVYHILEKIILQPIYSTEYIYIIKELDNTYDIKDIVCSNITKIFKSINIEKTNNSEYDKLCNKNKLIDNLIGYYRMIIQINCIKLYNGDIINIINEIIENIKISDDEEQYKYLQCLQSIIKTDNKLHSYIDSDLSNHLKSKKNKFQLMDINDLV